MQTPDMCLYIMSCSSLVLPAPSSSVEQRFIRDTRNETPAGALWACYRYRTHIFNLDSPEEPGRSLVQVAPVHWAVHTALLGSAPRAVVESFQDLTLVKKLAVVAEIRYAKSSALLPVRKLAVPLLHVSQWGFRMQPSAARQLTCQTAIHSKNEYAWHVDQKFTHGNCQWCLMQSLCIWFECYVNFSMC